jgi:glycosyltransferase involved in cell wall biosynthesis
MTAVTVALPINRLPNGGDGRGAARLRAAFESIVGQAHRELEILIVANGADEGTLRSVRELAASDPRARVVELAEANLGGALNAALAEASHELVARMDADDWCVPSRLAVQVEEMLRRPEIAALGCAWEQADERGQVGAVVRPPCNRSEARWRLLIGNSFAHGSMMLRRSAVLAVGG